MEESSPGPEHAVLDSSQVELVRNVVRITSQHDLVVDLNVKRGREEEERDREREREREERYRERERETERQREERR